MSDEFIRRGLTISVAQICSNIGWHSMSSSTLQVMTDILYEYLKDMAQSVKKFALISDVIEPDFDDVKMAFRDKEVVISHLMKYLKQMDCIKYPQQIPKFPIPTKSNLNMIKPGSNEIKTNCIHDNLPGEHFNQPLLYSSTKFEIINDPLCLQKLQDPKNDRQSNHNMVVHRQLREISSVCMTKTGCFSPSREGKLPESRLLQFPNFKKSLKQISYPTVLPEVKNEYNPYECHKILLPKTISVNEIVENIVENNNINHSENIKIKKLSKVNEISNLKPQLKKSSKFNKSKLSLLNIIFDKPIQGYMSKNSKNLLDNNEKLATEPNKQKLKLFKKLSKNKEISEHLSTIISKSTSTIVSSDALLKPETKSEVIEKIKFKPEPVESLVKKKGELNPKKRKRKEKISNEDLNLPNQISTGLKKLKNKHNLDLYSPLKFSFFGNLENGSSVLPSSLTKNPLVPNYDNLNKVLPILEKSNTITSIMYLPTPGENNFDKIELHKSSSSIISENEIKPKKGQKKERIKSNKKKKRNKKRKKKAKKQIKSEETNTLIKGDSLVPKIKLKLPSSNNKNLSTSLQRNIIIKQTIKKKSCPVSTNDVSEKTLPGDQMKSPVSKPKILDKNTLFMAISNKEELTKLPEKKRIKPKKSMNSSNTMINNDPQSSESNLTSNNNNNNNKKAKSSSKNIQGHPAFYFDEIGNQIWICPTCLAADDGSPMIGCDSCDAWYHWVCVGIQCPPDCAVWYCPTCQLILVERGVTIQIEKTKRGRPLKRKTIL